MSLDYPRITAEQSDRIREIVAAGPGDALVPGCPDWNLSDLGWHLAGVQRWAASVVSTGEASDPDPPDPPPPTAADAMGGATRELLAALDAADPVDPGWNFTAAAQTKAFWFRRQALEASLHRWDAESAVTDAPTPIDTEVAADAIDELVHVMLQRVIDREGIDVAPIEASGPCDVHIHCTDTEDLGVPGEWTFEIVDGSLRIVDEHRKAAVAIRGPASDLALFLYNRVGDEAVEIFGDRGVLEAWSPVLRF